MSQGRLGLKECQTHLKLAAMNNASDKEEGFKLSTGLTSCAFSGRNNQTPQCQIAAYENFIHQNLPQIIEGFNPIDICNSYLPEHGCYRYILSMTLKNPTISRPTILEKDGSTKAMLPNDARLRNLTYAAPLTVDVHITAKTFAGNSGEIGTADGGRGTGDKMYLSETKRILSVNLGRIPLMVGSKYCMLSDPNYIPNGKDECTKDKRGYFIINGSEKVVVNQDKKAVNCTTVHNNTKTSCFSTVAECRSVQESKFGVPKTLTLKLASRPNQFGRSIKISIHHIKHDVPITILFRALGVESDRDIAMMIVRGSWGCVGCVGCDGGAGASGGTKTNNQSHQEELIVEQLAASFDEGSSIRTVQAAQEYLAAHLAASNHHYNAGALAGSNDRDKDGSYKGPSHEQRLGALRSVLRKDLLPHVGGDFLKKALYIGHMTCRLIECFLGIRPLDDRDSYVNKRLDTTGVLMANLFRQSYGKMIKDMRSQVQKDINSGNRHANNKFINVVGKSNVYKLFKPTTIEASLKHALATGNWGVKTSRMQQGVAQVLNRLNYMSSESQKRKAVTPIKNTGKLVEPRKLHPTQHGIVCPSETPEGASVGLVKNLALLTIITVSAPSDPIHSVLDELGISRFDGSGRISPREALDIFKNDAVRIYVNGDLVGAHRDPSKLFEELRNLKRQGAIDVFTSISWAVTHKEINICTDGGRFVRPLLVVDQKTGRLVLENPENSKLLENAKSGKAIWHELVLSGAIEYLDGDEVEGSVIAMTLSELRMSKTFDTFKRWSHMEVSPAAMLGIVAGSIPYSDHNQAPRNCFTAEDHEVFTEHGFIGLDEILNHTADGKKLGVACYVDERLEFHQIGRDQVVYKDDQGKPLTATEFVHFEKQPNVQAEAGRGVSLLATTNHNMYGRLGFADMLGPNSYRWPGDGVPPAYKTQEAGEILQLKDSDMNPRVPVFQLKCNFVHGVSVHDVELPFTAQLGLVTDDHIDAFLWLYGYWLGDGWQDAYISFGPKNQQDVDKLTDVFSRLPLPQLQTRRYGAHGFWKAQKFDSKGQWNFAICSSTWWDYFEHQYDNASLQARHEIPKWVWSAKWFCSWVFNSLNASQLKTVIDGLSSADGNQSVNSLSDGTIHTSSARFRDEVERACILAGYSVVSHLNRETDSWNVVYTVASVSATPYMSIGEDITSVTLQDPAPIFCVTVPTDSHLIMVRRKGSRNEPAHRAAIVGNTYQSAMGKQAIGVYASNYRHRFDTMAHVLNYPQKPMVSTQTARIMNCNTLPYGINTIVAIACFTGFNQEDSVIVNKSAIDRGLFVSTFYRTFREQNNKNHSTGEEEFFCKPDPAVTRNMKPHNYDKVGPSGFVDENTLVHGGDVIIGKCMPQKQGHTVTNKDTSVALKSNERGFIDRNCYGNRHFTNVTGDGYTFAKVRVRQERIPTIGDKVSSRHGQKGTIGMRYREEDMPFTSSGIIPSLIMNPHAIPSRMTIGQLMEAIDSKAGAFSGHLGDATPFNGRTVEDIAEELEGLGAHRYGDEVMYNPRTGEQVPCAVFLCPTYYQRLKHMVEDKVHSRAANGPVVLMTRQPAEGRARDGGLRIGEMEVEAICAHGMHHFLKERFMETSDNYRMFLCTKCGMFATVNPESGIHNCKACKNILEFAEIRVPYSMKLMLQEVECMSIGARFIVDNSQTVQKKDNAKKLLAKA